MNTRATIAATGVIVFAAAANAGVITFEDPGIFAPTNNAQVDVYWVSTNAGYTGELSMVDNTFDGSSQKLWSNHTATPGQRVTLPRLYAQGERIDFTYGVTVGTIDVFSTGNEADWSQFSVNASDPFDVLVGVEDIRYPRGDMDHNDAVFRVVFSEASVPAPGSFALLGGGCLIMLRRRR